MSRYSVLHNHKAIGRIAAWAVILGLMLAPVAFAQRTELKPGMNFFSPQQDVELGQQVAQDAEQKLPMLGDSKVDDYLNRLGKRLASKAPGEAYPYQFKCVNDPTINAFALPGGFLYIHRGIIEAADNEAELAGVIGHEIAHVALRHGTNQASKAYLAQAPLAILGQFLGTDSVGAILAQIGTSFALNSVLLKYSRDAERQADLMGAQILFDLNYDPHYQAQFFEKLETGGRGTDFFSSHPNPDNRIENINEEIRKLGTNPRGKYVSDSDEFHQIKQYVKSMPPPPEAGSTSGPSSEPAGKPSPPSDGLRSYSSGNLSFKYPESWKLYGEELNITVAPDGGIVSRDGKSALAYGAVMAVFEPDTARGSKPELGEATDQLIASLQSSNPSMNLRRQRRQTRIAGEQAMSAMYTNDSPLGGSEINWLVTSLRPEGLLYFIFVVPEEEYSDYRDTFRDIVDSIRFSDL